MNSYSGGRRKDSIRGISFPIWKYNFVDTLSQLTVASLFMTANPYRRISPDDIDHPVKETQIDNSTSVDYYRDNEDDRASDKDSLLEKSPSSSPSVAERGSAGSGWSSSASKTDLVCEAD